MAHGRTSHQRGREWLRRLLTLSPATLALATVAVTGADFAYRLAGDSFIPGGPLDEVAHLLTTLLVLSALGPRICERFLVPALVASVAIDLDHVPGQLGANLLTAGTPRPYTHSLLSIAVVLAVAWRWRRRRDLALGIALGLAIHFWRDMAEGDSGVSLLWPVSSHSLQYPRGVYLAAMGAFVLVDAARCASGDRSVERRRSRRPHAIRTQPFVRRPEEA